MTQRRELLLIRESLRDAILSDVATAVTIGGMIAIGRWIESSALEWFGAVLAFVVIVGRAAKTGKRFNSVADARAYLDSLDAEEPAP